MKSVSSAIEETLGIKLANNLASLFLVVGGALFGIYNSALVARSAKSAILSSPPRFSLWGEYSGKERNAIASSAALAIGCGCGAVSFSALSSNLSWSPRSRALIH